MPEHAGFLPCRPCDRQELCAGDWPTLAPRTTGTDESPRGPGTTPSTASSRAGGLRGPSVGGSATRRGEAMGRGPPHLSRPFGEPLAHAPSLPSFGLDAADFGTG